MAYSTLDDLIDFNYRQRLQPEERIIIDNTKMEDPKLSREKYLKQTLCRPFSIQLCRLANADIEQWKNKRKSHDKPDKPKMKRRYFWSRGICKKKLTKKSSNSPRSRSISSTLTNDERHENLHMPNESLSVENNEDCQEQLKCINENLNIADDSNENISVSDSLEWKFKRKRRMIIDSDSDEIEQSRDDFIIAKKNKQQIFSSNSNVSINESITNNATLSPEKSPLEEVANVLTPVVKIEPDLHDDESKMLENETIEEARASPNENINIGINLENVSTDNTDDNTCVELGNDIESENIESDLVVINNTVIHKVTHMKIARVVLFRLEDTMRCFDKGYTVNDIEKLSIENVKSLKAYSLTTLNNKLIITKKRHSIESDSYNDIVQRNAMINFSVSSESSEDDDSDSINDDDYSPSYTSDSESSECDSGSSSPMSSDDDSESVTSITRKIIDNTKDKITPIKTMKTVNEKIILDESPKSLQIVLSESEDLVKEIENIDKTKDSSKKSKEIITTSENKEISASVIAGPSKISTEKTKGKISPSKKKEQLRKSPKPKLKKKRRLAPKSMSKECEICLTTFENREQLSEHLFKHTTEELQEAYQVRSKIAGESTPSETSSVIDVEASSVVGISKTKLIPCASKPSLEVSQKNNEEIDKLATNVNIQTNPPTVANQLDVKNQSYVNSTNGVLVCACHNDNQSDDTNIQIEMVLYCETCCVLFRRSECFETHYRGNPKCNEDRKKGRSPRLYCTSCRLLLNSLTEMRCHLEKHASKDIQGTVSFVCNICRVVFFGVGTVFCTHWFSHEKDTHFVASRYSFPKLCVSNRGKRPSGALPDEQYLFVAEFVCRFCKLQCLSESELSDHLKKGCNKKEVVKKTVPKPPEPQKPPEKIVKKSRVIAMKTMPLTSPKSSTSKMDLIKDWICDFCDKSFPDRGGFEEHTPDHLQETGYPGYLCVFHSDMKAAYICNVCRSVFSTMNELTKHWNTHNLIKFICTVCNESFGSLSVFYRHVAHRCYYLQAGCRVSYGKNHHTCKICKAMVSSNEELTRHHATHHKATTETTIVEAQTTQPSLPIEIPTPAVLPTSIVDETIPSSTIAIADSSQSNEEVPSSTQDAEKLPIVVNVQSLDPSSSQAPPQPASYVINITLPNQGVTVEQPTIVNPPNSIVSTNIVNQPKLRALEDPSVQIVLANNNSNANVSASIVTDLTPEIQPDDNIQKFAVSMNNDGEFISTNSKETSENENNLSVQAETLSINEKSLVETRSIDSLISKTVPNLPPAILLSSEVAISSSESEESKYRDSLSDESRKQITKENAHIGENPLTDTDESDEIQIIDPKSSDTTKQTQQINSEKLRKKNYLANLIKKISQGQIQKNSEKNVPQDNLNNIITEIKGNAKETISTSDECERAEEYEIIVLETTDEVEKQDQPPPEHQGGFLRVKNLSELMDVDKPPSSINDSPSSLNTSKTLTDLLISKAQAVTKSPEKPQQLRPIAPAPIVKRLLPYVPQRPNGTESRRANPLMPRTDSNYQLPNPMYRLNISNIMQQNGSTMTENSTQVTTASNNSVYSAYSQSMLKQIILSPSSNQYQRTPTFTCPICIPAFVCISADELQVHMDGHYTNNISGSHAPNAQNTNVRNRLSPPSYETHVVLTRKPTQVPNDQMNRQEGGAIFYNCKICKQFKTLIKSDVVKHVGQCYQHFRRQDIINSARQQYQQDQRNYQQIQQRQEMEIQQQREIQSQQVRQYQHIQQSQTVSTNSFSGNSSSQPLLNCVICTNFQYRQLEELEQHIQIYHPQHSSSHMVQCTFCPMPRLFTSQEALNLHETTAHPHICNVCMRMFMSAADLQNHRNEHRHALIPSALLNTS